MSDIVLEIGDEDVVDQFNSGRLPHFENLERTGHPVKRLLHFIDIAVAASAVGIRVHAGDTQRWKFQARSGLSSSDRAAFMARQMEVSSREMAYKAKSLSSTNSGGGRVIVFCGSDHSSAVNPSAAQTIERNLRQTGIKVGTVAMTGGLAASIINKGRESAARARPAKSDDILIVDVTAPTISADLATSALFGALANVRDGVEPSLIPELENLKRSQPGLAHYLVGRSYEAASAGEANLSDENGVEAIKAYLNSAELGRPESMLDAARLFTLLGDPQLAAKAWRQAGELGMPGTSAAESYLQSDWAVSSRQVDPRTL